MINSMNNDDSSVLEASANLLELATSKNLYAAENDSNISSVKLTDAQFRALYYERSNSRATEYRNTAELFEPSLLSVRTAKIACR